jgi:hypothetical protein
MKLTLGLFKSHGREEQRLEVYEAAFIAERLKQNRIKDLDLCNMEMENEEAAEFRDGLDETQGLKAFQIQGNKIGDIGASQISTGMTMNKSVEALNMSSNAFQNPGGKAISDMLVANKTLKDLNILDQKSLGITRSGEDAMAPQVQKNSTLVRLNQDIQLKDKQSLDLSNRNRQLALYEAAFMGVRIQDPDQGKTCESINLEQNRVDGKAALYFCDGLPKAVKLKNLMMSHNELKDDGTKELGNGLQSNRTVEELQLRMNQIGSTGGRYLSTMIEKNSKLVSLSVHNSKPGGQENNEFTDEGPAADSFGSAFEKNKVVRVLNSITMLQETFKPPRQLVYLYEMHFIGQRLNPQVAVVDAL